MGKVRQQLVRGKQQRLVHGRQLGRQRRLVRGRQLGRQQQLGHGKLLVW